MSGETLLIERSPGETRAALLRDHVVWQVDHHRDIAPSRVGGVYAGRVRRIDPTTNAAFVDIGAPGDGFLRARDAVTGERSGRGARIGEVVHEGETIMVTVVADGFAGKGPRLARARAAVVPPGRPAPACLEPPLPPVEHILTDHAHPSPARVVCNEAASEAAARRWLAEKAPEERIVLVREDAALFEAYEVEDAIAGALARRLAVGDGVELVFDPTESLCAIDINSARHIGRAGRGARDVNLAAMLEIARQLRLRAIAGAIVIDALKMGRGDDRRQVLTALRRALKDDPAACHVLGISNLGLIELTRTRTGPSLAERLTEPAAAPRPRPDTLAYDALRRLTRAARARPRGRYVLRAAPEVIEQLRGDLRATFDEAVARLGDVGLDPQPGWPRERMEIADRDSC